MKCIKKTLNSSSHNHVADFMNTQRFNSVRRMYGPKRQSIHFLFQLFYAYRFDLFIGDFANIKLSPTRFTISPCLYNNAAGGWQSSPLRNDFCHVCFLEFILDRRTDVYKRQG